jgi:hypothetical protein
VSTAAEFTCRRHSVGVLPWTTASGLGLPGSADLSARQSRRTLAALTRWGSQTGANAGRRRATPGDGEPWFPQLDRFSGLIQPSAATARKCLLSSRPRVRVARGAQVRRIFATAFKACSPAGSQTPRCLAAASSNQLKQTSSSPASPAWQRQSEPHEVTARHRPHALFGVARLPGHPGATDRRFRAVGSSADSLGGRAQTERFGDARCQLGRL